MEIMMIKLVATIIMVTYDDKNDVSDDVVDDDD